MKVLFLTHRLPYAPNRGDRIRSYHTLRLLNRHHEVDLVSLTHDADEAAAAAGMNDLATSVQIARVPKLQNLARAAISLPGTVPLTHTLLDAGGLRERLAEHVRRNPPNLVIAYCSGMARFALEPPLNRFPFLLDMVDVDSRKWSMLASRTSQPMRWVYQREARHLSRFEALAVARSRVTTVVNARERETLIEITGGSNVHVVPNGIDASTFKPAGPPETRPRVVFTGVMDYQPNEEGALWMAQHVWPIVRARRPDAQLVFVGANPTRALKRLPHVDPSIEVTGTVPDVRPYLWEAAVSVVPLATARGVQNKVLEAVAAGLPVVVTMVVREGFPSQLDPACLVANNPQAFAAAVLSLLDRTPAERQAMAQSVDLTSLDWTAQLSPFLQLIDAASSKQGHADD